MVTFWAHASVAPQAPANTLTAKNLEARITAFSFPAWELSRCWIDPEARNEVPPSPPLSKGVAAKRPGDLLRVKHAPQGGGREAGGVCVACEAVRCGALRLPHPLYDNS